MKKRKVQIIMEFDLELEDYEGEGLIEKSIRSMLDDSPFWNPKKIEVNEIKEVK